jgi:hypothetical protein
MCMYIYIYICIYIYIPIFSHNYVYMNIYIGKAVLLAGEMGGNIILRRHDDEEEVCMYIYVCISVYIYIYINVHIYVCMYECILGVYIYWGKYHIKKT